MSVLHHDLFPFISCDKSVLTAKVHFYVHLLNDVICFVCSGCISKKKKKSNFKPHRLRKPNFYIK